MNIKNITIENFRSIEHVSINLSSFNVFVGQNNHGKTNFFEAIEWFYLGKGDMNEIKRKESTGQILIEVEFDDIQSGLQKMKNPKNKSTIEKIIKERKSVKIKRESIDPTKRYIYNEENSQWEETGTGFDRALNDFLPKLEFVKTETNLKEVAKYGRNTPINEMLTGVLNEILEKGDSEYSRFKDEFDKLFGDKESKINIELREISKGVKVHLQKQFPDCTDVDFDVKQPAFEDLLKNFEIKVDDGFETSASEKGDGMQRALMLAIIQTYADFRRKNLDAKNFLFIIDEGELHLHPSAQRNLKNALFSISSEGDQVLLSTHSSVLICDEEANQSIFKVEKQNKVTHLSSVTKLHKQNVVFDLLGGSPSDLLLPRNFLIVEGPTEFEFLNRVIEKLYPGEKNIQIIKALGDISQSSRLYNAIVKLFTPLEESIYKDRVVFIFDKFSDAKMSEGAFDEFKAKYPFLKENQHLFVLPVCSIEEYYPSALPTQIDSHNDVPKWKRTHEEVRTMESSQKLRLGRSIGEKITKEQFENEMDIIFKALSSCWSRAF